MFLSSFAFLGLPGKFVFSLLDGLCGENLTPCLFIVYRAVNVYKTPAFGNMRRNCITQDLSWEKPARKWEAVVEEVLDGGKAATDKKQSVNTPVVELAKNW